jgi:hypothetical protein
MSVEKFIVTKDDSGYTILPNKVLKGLQPYPTALGVWCSLASLPQQWEFYKDKIYSDFNIGRDKLKKIFEILEKCNLIVVTQLRDSQGRFGDWSLHVKNGTEFIPFTGFQSTVKTPFTDLPLTVNQSLVNSTYKRKTDLSSKDFKEKKEKSFCVSENQKSNEPKRPVLQEASTLLNQIHIHNTENPYCGEESNKNGASTSIEYKVIHRNYNNYIHNTENPQSGSATLWETRTHSNKRDLSSKAFKDYKNKSSYDQKYENEKKPAWADSKDKMANETKHIEAHEESKKAEINAYQPNGVGQRTLEKILKELGGYHPKTSIKQ